MYPSDVPLTGISIMYPSDVPLTGISINASEMYVSPDSYLSFNATMSDVSSSAVRTTETIFSNYFLATISDTASPGVQFNRFVLREPSGEQKRQSGSLEDSPLQMVSRQVKDKVCFIFVMVLIPCFCVFGSVGNMLSLRVLVHHRMRNSTNMVLAALSISDLMFLLHALYFSCLKLYSLRNPVAGEQLRSVTFPLLGPYGSVITARITTCLTTMLSLERLIAVYFPIKAKVMCSKAMSMTCILMIYLMTAAAFIPNALKYHSYPVTFNNKSSYKMELTELGMNSLFYSIYGNILNILFRLIPILILIMVNIFIAMAIRRTWSFRRTMSGGGSAAYEQNRITLMLLMVSLIFLICILPGAVHSITEQIYKQYAWKGLQSNIYDVVRNVTYFLETVNSSVNFVIYMAFSTKFCRTYKQIFCCTQQDIPSRRSARSVIRFTVRQQNGSKSSMTSYRELYFLSQLGNRKVFCLREREHGMPVAINGLVTHSGAITEEASMMLFKGRCSSSDSYSGHSNSHSGHSNSHSGHSNSHSGHSNSYSGHSNSHSGHSNSHSGHSNSHCGHSNGHCGHSNSHSGHSNSYSGHSISHSGYNKGHSGHNTQGKGFSHQSTNSVHSNHSLESSAAEMYS